jgi:hypothetical protein
VALADVDPGLFGNLRIFGPRKVLRVMFVGRQSGQWICRACRTNLYNHALQRKSFRTSSLRWQSVEGIPPGLILRAKKMALQHQELEQKAAAMTEYTPQTVQLYKRISELADVAANLKQFEESQKVCRKSYLLICRTLRSSLN